MAVMRPDHASAESSGWASIEAVFAALESPLLGYALRLTGDRAVAEDIVQDAFVKLHAQFNEVRQPQSWLYRIVHNAALNHRRDSAKVIPLSSPTPDSTHNSPPSSANDLADESLPPDEQIARLEGIGLVRLSLESLDERSRELIRLKFHEDLTYQQISERTGLKPGHVGYLLHHALKAIADELARNGVVP